MFFGLMMVEKEGWMLEFVDEGMGFEH